MSLLNTSFVIETGNMMETLKYSKGSSEFTGDDKIGKAELDQIRFPFKTVLSFRKLIDFWKREAESKKSERWELAASVIKKIETAPELLESITDFSVLDKHFDLLEVLMSAVYPASQWDRQIMCSNVPFQFETFFSSPRCRQIFNVNETNRVPVMKIDSEAAKFGKILNAYSFILRECYDIKLKIDHPFIVEVVENVTGLTKYFQLSIDPQFIEIKVNGDLPLMNELKLKEILRDITDLNTWNKILPPEKFEFHGFASISALNVTDREILSSLKHDLLERESIISKERFGLLQNKLRSFFRLPDLKLGLAGFPDENEAVMDYGQKIGDSFILNDSCRLTCSDFLNSIYDKAAQSGKPYIVEDISELPDKTRVEGEILKQGIRNIIVAPLSDGEKIIGVLELGCEKPGELTSVSLLKLKEVLTLFSIAVKRSLEEYENKIQALIKEECTAIHPSVEWRFREAAENLIRNKVKSGPREMEPIVFENVFPLYGLSDVRESSAHRNEAIAADLTAHLNMVKRIIIKANEINNMPLYDEIIHRIDLFEEELMKGLASGDEVTILEFLHGEINDVFNHLSEVDPELKKMIISYKSKLDPELFIYYNKRKDFEDSVSMINEEISAYIDEAETFSQRIFPHYFEKYKTDGVEYGMYIGASLVKNKKFDEIYLKNLRLWQLIMMCGIVKKSEKIKPKLKIALDTAHLILVQTTPLAIRFRYDEKKFDVDGTYNIRYEILKKRIDKAVVKGARERLTQPGKIAVIYSQNREALEYRRYIDYLIAKEILQNKIEDLELEDMQGVQGLRALRVTVNLNSEALQKDNDFKETGEEVFSQKYDSDKLIYTN